MLISDVTELMRIFVEIEICKIFSKVSNVVRQ